MKIQGVDGGTLRDVLVDSSGRVVLSPTSGTNTVVDGSGTITTGGAAQNLFGGTVPAAGFEIYNPHGSDSLWISKQGTAAPNTSGSIEVPPGGMYTTPQAYVPNHVISIYGGTTGQPFTAERW